MKISQEIVGKRVYVRLRVGGSYTGKVDSIADGTTKIVMGNGGVVSVQNSMIASIEVLGDSDGGE